MVRPARRLAAVLAAIGAVAGAGATATAEAQANKRTLSTQRQVTVTKPTSVRVAVRVQCRAATVRVRRAPSTKTTAAKLRAGRQANVRVALPAAGRHRLHIRATRLRGCKRNPTISTRLRVAGSAAGAAVRPPLQPRPAAPTTPPNGRTGPRSAGTSATVPPTVNPPAPRPADPAPAPRGPAPTRPDGSAVPLGAAVTLNRYTDDYGAAFRTHFDSLTPENEMKMDTVRPAPDTWNFGPADTLVKFARDHGKTVRGHTLLWTEQVPGWLREQDWSREQWREYTRDYIHTVVGRYAGQVDSWDVVNEPIADDTGGLKDTFWLKKLGPGYIADALRWAREADPNARMFINDYAVEKFNRKSDSFFDLARQLKAEGAPLDAVGFQAHVLTSWYPSQTELETNLDRFAKLGVRTEITEADVDTKPMRDETAQARHNALSTVYGTLARACANTSACDRFTVWGVDDSRTWLKGDTEPLLLDENLALKPAYGATRAGLRRQ